FSPDWPSPGPSRADHSAATFSSTHSAALCEAAESSAPERFWSTPSTTKPRPFTDISTSTSSRAADFGGDSATLPGPLASTEAPRGGEARLRNLLDLGGAGAEMPSLGSQDSNLDMAGQSRPSCPWTTPHRLPEGISNPEGRAFGVAGRTRTA